MKHSSKTKQQRSISAARRGQIIQRVIVDGWTTAHAAAVFGMPPGLVEIWVADYRRYGMASLRRPAPRTVIAESLQLWLLHPVVRMWHRISSGPRRPFVLQPRAAPAPMRTFQDDGRSGSS